MIRRVLLIIIFVFSAALSNAAQDPKVELGKPEELKGLVRIHLQTEEERARRYIVKEIEQKLPQLTFVEKAEDAQIVLIFQEIRRHYRTRTPSPRGSVERRGTARQIESNTSSGPPAVEFEITAFGAVTKPVGPTASRRLLKFADTLSSSLEDKLSIEFARAFIKIYQKANHQ